MFIIYIYIFHVVLMIGGNKTFATKKALFSYCEKLRKIRKQKETFRTKNMVSQTIKKKLLELGPSLGFL